MKENFKKEIFLTGLTAVIFLVGLFSAHNLAQAAICTGRVPSHATMYGGDNLLLRVDTPYTYSARNTTTKCQYGCNVTYSWSGSACVSSIPTYSCIGTVPASATLCSGDDTRLTADTTRKLASSCTSARKCEYTCSSGSVLHYSSPNYCSATCNEDVPCDTTLNIYGGDKYCRKINDKWEWVSTAYTASICNESREICQTYQCCTSTGCVSSGSSREKGYCGFDDDKNLLWIDSGSASCPYSISVNRDKSSYQLTADCADNLPGDNAGCQTGDVKISVTGSPDNNWLAEKMVIFRYHTGPGISEFSNGLMLNAPTWRTPSGGTYDYWYYPDSKGYITINNANCCIPGSSGCVGHTAPGDYEDHYSIAAKLYKMDYFTINCDNYCGTSGCGTTNYALAVTKNGTGLGTVTSNPTGISCGTDCTENYTSGTSVTLAAYPGLSSSFAGWSGGGCSGTGTCAVSMTAAKTITATFNVAATACTAGCVIVDSNCSASCGGGTKITEHCIRTDCTTFDKIEACATQPCPPSYKEVAPW